MSTRRDQVLAEARPLATLFAEAGRSLYLVGGIVRDLLVLPAADGDESSAALDELDFDLTTDAHPREVKKLVGPLADALWTQGEKFGTIGAQIDGRPYEITTFRAESYSSDTRKPDVQFGDSLEVDLSRRDFTINAMAIDVATGELIDPFDGFGALEARELRTPIEPRISFSDDPLRMLRAARFIARYGLTVERSVVEAATELIDRMSIVSVERIREELDKLLAAERPSEGLAFLAQIGAWRYIVPSMPSDSIDALGDVLDRSPRDLTLRRAVVFRQCPASERRSALDMLKYSNADAREIGILLEGIDVVSKTDTPMSDSMVRQLVDRLGYESMPMLLRVLEALDVSDRSLASVFSSLDSREDLADLSPVLTGDEVMDVLGLSPGPEVGRAMRLLKQRRFAHGPTDRAGEIAFLRDAVESL